MAKKGGKDGDGDEIRDEDARDSDAITDDERAGLSPEEIAALEESDDDADTLAEIAAEADSDDDADADDEDDADGEGDAPKVEGKDGEDDDADDDAADGEGEGEPAKVAKDEGEDAQAQDGDGDDDADLEDDTYVSRVEVKDVENYNERMAEFDAKFKELDKKYEDGDVNVQEYVAQSRELDGQRNELIRQHDKAMWAQEQNEQNEKNAWDRAQSHFFSRHHEYGDDPVLFSALDGAVKTLAAREENRDRSLAWVLNQAHKEVAKRFRPADSGGQEGNRQKGGKDANDAGDADANKDKGKAKAAETRKNRRPDLQVVPKTLGQLPAADTSDDGGEVGEFAALDKLEGMEYENALAALTPAQQERYLNAR